MNPFYVRKTQVPKDYLSLGVYGFSYTGLIGIMVGRCGHCGAKASLRCSSCLVVYYCCHDHQKAHFPKHKSGCKAIKRLSAKLKREEDELRSNHDDLFEYRDVFETQVGHFWGIYETRDYMRAKNELLTEFERMGNPEALQAALTHAMDCLRLCRSDNMGIRGLIPSMMIRLNKDQECYDFMKWWATSDPDGTYNWGDMSLPYLNIHGADATENISTWESLELNHNVAVTLVKCRAMLALKAMIGFDLLLMGTHPRVGQHSHMRLLAGKSGVLRAIRDYSPTKSPVLPSFSFIQARGGAEVLLAHLHEQVVDQVMLVSSINPHVWGGLLSPKRILAMDPCSYSIGSIEEAHFAVRSLYPAWRESPGALGILRDVLQ